MITTYAEAITSTVDELIYWLEKGHTVNGYRQTIREGIDRRISRMTKSEVTPEQVDRICNAIDNLPFAL